MQRGDNMSYFLDEKTIRESFDNLNSIKYRSANELFSFLLLKAAGFDKLDFIDLGSEEIKKKVFNTAKQLAGLFTNEDIMNSSSHKHNFIDPFSMEKWGSGNPSEPLKKWANNRFKNNISGGGEQWKYLVIYDENDTGTVKEREKGIDKVIKETRKIPLDAIAVWFFRFSEFSHKASKSQLIQGFLSSFNIDNDEQARLFSSTNTININFNSEMTNPSEIREWIGNPKGSPQWIDDNLQVDMNAETNNFISGGNFTKFDANSAGNKDLSFLKSLLNSANQEIFMGAPGTSKSYMAEQLAKEFDHVERIQFHPQYTYQEFIGGQVLEKGNLVKKKGIFIKFLEKAISNQDESFLFIIDEINRANVSQVFGELIQLLDRDEHIKLSFDVDHKSIEKDYYLPANLKIIGTMNTTDRTVGRLDFALKRRFYQIHFYPDYNLLTDKVSLIDNSIAISDLLRKINENLVINLNNKEMVIGHAMFLNPSFSQQDGSFVWKKEEFCNLFNYLIEPIVEDYCDNNEELIHSILGDKLPNQLSGSEFYSALEEFVQ